MTRGDSQRRNAPCTVLGVMPHVQYAVASMGAPALQRKRTRSTCPSAAAACSQVRSNRNRVVTKYDHRSGSPQNCPRAGYRSEAVGRNEDENADGINGSRGIWIRIHDDKRGGLGRQYTDQWFNRKGARITATCMRALATKSEQKNESPNFYASRMLQHAAAS